MQSGTGWRVSIASEPRPPVARMRKSEHGRDTSAALKVVLNVPERDARTLCTAVVPRPPEYETGRTVAVIASSYSWSFK